MRRCGSAYAQHCRWGRMLEADAHPMSFREDGCFREESQRAGSPRDVTKLSLRSITHYWRLLSSPSLRLQRKIVPGGRAGACACSPCLLPSPSPRHSNQDPPLTAGLSRATDTQRVSRAFARISEVRAPALPRPQSGPVNSGATHHRLALLPVRSRDALPTADTFCLGDT